MLSHCQNLHVLRGRQWTGRGEAQSRELANSIKNVPVLMFYFLLSEIRLTATLESLKGKAYVMCSCVFKTRVTDTETPYFFILKFGIQGSFVNFTCGISQLNLGIHLRRGEKEDLCVSYVAS
jgi:hypothetical protein